MKALRYLLIPLCILCLLSCAAIPSSTSKLTKEVISEADGMHQLNVSLVNQLFEEREQRINNFITYEYTPALLENFQKMLPDSVNYQEELPNILKSIVPVINKKRDSLQGIMSSQKTQILGELQSTYTTYTRSTSALQNLIDSAVKLDSAEKDALTAIENLTGVSPNTVQTISSTLDNLLIKSGTTVDEFTQLINTLKQ